VLPEGAQYKKAITLDEIEQILGIKNIPGIDQLEEIKQIYVIRALEVAWDKEAWQSKSRSL
jgi:ethanolamine transporter EutH